MATTLARTIRLRKKLVSIHMSRRPKKSVDYLRDDVARHAKADVSKVRISNTLNSYLIDKISRSMGPVRITVEKDGEMVKADLAQDLKRKPAKIASQATEKKTAVPAKQTPAQSDSAEKKPAQKQGAQWPKAPEKAHVPSAGAQDKKVK